MTWKPSVSSGSFKSERWVRGHGFRSYMVRGTIGTARKFEDGKELIERCGHVHRKRSAAAKCAERLAKELNGEVRRTPDGLPITAKCDCMTDLVDGVEVVAHHASTCPDHPDNW